MNLFDLLTKKNVPDYTKDMPPLQPVTQATTGEQALPLVQVDMNGTLAGNSNTQPEINKIPETKPQNKTTSFGSKLANALFGRAAEPTDNIQIDNSLLNTNSAEAPISSTISENPRSGGIFSDIASGYKENRFNPISLSNLMPNKDKNFAYRLGEGLGSIARFAVSPAGRGLGVAGAIGLTGGNLDDVLAYGVNTAAQNQMNRANDKLYRNELKNNYVQSVQNDPRYNTLTNSEDAQIQEIIKNSSEYKNAKTNEEKNSIALQMYQTMAADKILSKQNEAIDIYKNNLANTKGFITNNAYEQLMKAQQLRDNAAYRKMYYDAQQANLRENMQFRKDQAKAEQEYKNLMLNFQKQKEASDRAYQNAQLGLGYSRLNNDNYNKALDRAEKAKDRAAKILSKQENYGDIEKQINNFKATFKGLPSKAESYTFGNLRAMTGTQTTKEANFNAQRTLLFNQIARKLGGEKGVLSDQDMKRIELALPTLTDSYDQKIAKMRAVDDLLNIKKGGMPQTYTSGKYTVRVK